MLVSLDAPPVILAGLTMMLAAHSEEIRTGSWSEGRTDVAIVDVASRHGAIRLPSIAAPLVTLVRDGDLEADAFVRDIGAVSVPITARAPELVRAVQAAHALMRIPEIPPEDHGRGLGSDLTTALSPREAEVIRAICLGMTNNDIAKQMYLSINSIKTYIRSAYRKMGVRGRSQALLWGIDHGYKDNVVVKPPGPDD